MHERLGEHILWHVPVLGAVHADTIVTTWVVMVVSLAFFAWVGASYRSAYQSRRQVVVEGVVNYIADLATSHARAARANRSFRSSSRCSSSFS